MSNDQNLLIAKRMIDPLPSQNEIFVQWFKVITALRFWGTEKEMRISFRWYVMGYYDGAKAK